MPTAESTGSMAAIASIVSQAAPGEVNDVISDLSVLFGSDPDTLASIQEQLTNYNRDNLLEYQKMDKDEKVIFSNTSEMEDKRVFDPRTFETYQADHEKKILRDPQPYTAIQEDPQLKDLIQGVNKYVDSHYPKGFGTVLPCLGSGDYEIIVVASKYNPSNFCNARWCSRWKWNPSTLRLTGDIKGIVHFFEDGNVQLTLNHAMDTALEPNNTSSYHIFKAIEKAESQYQMGVNRFYSEMDQNCFRNLRRALPVTKTKIDWYKISNYRIGSELTNK